MTFTPQELPTLLRALHVAAQHYAEAAAACGYGKLSEQYLRRERNARYLVARIEHAGEDRETVRLAYLKSIVGGAA